VILATIVVDIAGDRVLGEKIAIEDHSKGCDSFEEPGECQCFHSARRELTVADTTASTHFAADNIVRMSV